MLSTPRSTPNLSMKLPPPREPSAKAKWPLWGAAAGIVGTAANLIANPQGAVTLEQAKSGSAVTQTLDRAGYHVAAVAGVLAVVCLIVTSAAWTRWANHRVGDNLVAGMVPVALLASAAAMIPAYGLMGALSLYLPGGIDAGRFPPEGLYALFMVVDVAPFIAWQGVAVAAALMGWLALGARVLPWWVGVVCLLTASVPLAALVAFGLPGLAGASCPVGMAIAFLGMALGEQARFRETPS